MRIPFIVCSTLVPVLFHTGCGPAHTSAPLPDVPPLLAHALTLPPTDTTAAALAELGRRARTSCPASSLQARYALDLFDWSRLLAESDPDGARALAVLWGACALPGAPARGRWAARQLVRCLSRMAGEGLGRCPVGGADHTSLQQIRQLIAADHAPRARVPDALQQAVIYKRIARSASPMADSARLRLTDWCVKAFRLAAGGEPPLQHVRLAHCLFPLFAADPSPYFAEDPAARPTDPPWPLLKDVLDRERRSLQSTRLASLARRLQDMDQAFFAEAGATLPTPLNLGTFALPRSDAGDPWTRTPVVMVTGTGYIAGGRPVLLGDDASLSQAIAARLRDDARRWITVTADPRTPASRVLEVAKAARRAGALTLALGVTREVAAAASPAEAQSAVFGVGRPVLRLEGIPLALALIASASATPPRDLPRGLGYDPRAARGVLAAHITRGRVHLMSRDGRLAPLPLEGLAAELDLLRRVYPEDRSMAVIPDAATTYAELVAVAGALRRQGGQPLFPGLALSPPGHLSQPEDDLAPVLRLLSTARASVEPRLSRYWPAAALGCYLETLREFVRSRRPPPQGTVILGPVRAGLGIKGGTLRHAKLRACIARELPAAPVAPASRVTVTLSLDR